MFLVVSAVPSRFLAHHDQLCSIYPLASSSASRPVSQSSFGVLYPQDHDDWMVEEVTRF